MNEWFGLAPKDNRLYRSVVSIYDHILDENECQSCPMLFGDFGNKEKETIAKKYRNFFEKNFQNCIKINHTNEKGYVESREYKLERELQFFLHDDIGATFLDYTLQVIYVCYFDLKILIYSVNQLNLILERGLYFPILNDDAVSWEETPWG